MHNLNKSKLNAIAFVDLDLTLIHSQSLVPGRDSVKKEKEHLLLKYSDVELYLVNLRPSAKKFLSHLRDRFERVCLLTAATSRYASNINEMHDLGFSKSKDPTIDGIFAREHTAARGQFLEWKGLKSILFDDIPLQEHWRNNTFGKVNFIEFSTDVTPVAIQVPEFYHYNDRDDEEDLGLPNEKEIDNLIAKHFKT